MLNLAVLLEDSAREVPERTAIACEGTRLSYAQLNAAANRVASGLVQAGIRQGDTIGLSCGDVPYFPIVYYGILKAGGVVVPMNILLKSREIEEVLMTHPAVSLAAVIGVPHDRHGEEVKAFVILKEGASITEVDLMVWSKENLADYKYPRMIEFRTALPMTATGKVLKSELRQG